MRPSDTMTLTGMLAFLFLILVELSQCSRSVTPQPAVARLYVRFVKYNNAGGKGANGHCCDGRYLCMRNGCDHKFWICVDRASGLDQSLRSCHHFSKQSSKIDDMNTITFGGAFGNVRNPIVIDLQKIPDAGNVSLKVDVWDDDGIFSGDDHVDTLRSLLSVTPLPKNIDHSTGHNRKEITYRTKLLVEWYTRCADHLYGPLCRDRCEETEKYSCDPATGRKICKKGWTGAECEDVAWCLSQPCLNGGTCKTKETGYTCTCRRGWSGMNCEVQGSPCDLNPCLPGGCINYVTTYICVCPPGYHASRIIKHDSCVESPTTEAPSTAATTRIVCPTLPPTTAAPATTTTLPTTQAPTTTQAPATTTTPPTTTEEKIEYIDRANADCDRLAQTGKRYQDGTYHIRVGRFPSFPVYCDMGAEGWTVIQERVSNRLGFHRSWEDYKNGFGNVGFNSNYFLGLEKIYWLTNQRRYKLTITVQLANRSFRYATYNEFWIESEANNYRLHVSGYSGTAGDALQPHSGAAFSTFDRDNDGNGRTNCASVTQSGWWFYSGTYNNRQCLTSNLNGAYITTWSGWPRCLANGKCILWSTIRNYYNYSLVKTQMKILPNPRSP